MLRCGISARTRDTSNGCLGRRRTRFPFSSDLLSARAGWGSGKRHPWVNITHGQDVETCLRVRQVQSFNPLTYVGGGCLEPPRRHRSPAPRRQLVRSRSFCNGARAAIVPDPFHGWPRSSRLIQVKLTAISAARKHPVRGKGCVHLSLASLSISFCF